ncbi:hypothetical protein BC629DRAFT_435778 [Irpex lacteus]|nr:hypothetical protein BC629DRAFT_435778 [Irpex lacteus]
MKSDESFSPCPKHTTYVQRSILAKRNANILRKDAVRVAREEFQLSGNATISFATRELPGCDGEAVEIHPRTWAAITPILAQITVKVEHGAPIGSNVVQRLTSEAPTLPDDSQREATPTARGKSKESTPGRDDQPAAVSRIRKRPSMAGPAANGAPRKSIVRLSISGVKEENVPRPSAAKPFINPFAGAASSYPRAELTGSRVAATPPPPAQQLNTHEEDGEEEEEEILKSPRKGKSARKRVMSDDELEYEEIEAPQSSEEGRGASARASSSNGGRASALVTPKQERAAKKARTPPRELAHSPTSTAVARPAERIVNSSETCLITVDYDDGHEVCSSTFKTKGRHSVHKVLMTVCKTFGIEDLYARCVLSSILPSPFPLLPLSSSSRRFEADD